MKKTHSIVVCVHNALDDVRMCMDSLLKDCESINEIIVVDDASDEATRSYLENELAEASSIIKIIRSGERLGYTKSANIGLRAANGSVVTLLNSDTIVPKGWSRKLLQITEEHPELGIIGPLSNAASYQSVPSTIGTSDQTAVNILPSGVTVEQMDGFCERAAQGVVMPYVPLVHGFCMTITRQCLSAVGEFDEEAFPLGYGEENDFCVRAQDAGFALGIAVNTYVFHAKSKSYASEERVHLMNAGWEALTVKHGRRRLARAIRIMEEQPALIRLRKAVAEGFDWLDQGNVEPETAKPLPAEAKILEKLAVVSDVKPIAFYLPQFHPLKINNLVWGEGFTEWNNVVRARPRFPGHFQPKYPGKLGFYDLRLPEIMHEQAELARMYGVHGICMYYYRLDGRRLMAKPSENLLRTKSINMNFCFCWANEDWTRAWDGKTSDVILSQNYDDETLWGIVDDVAEASEDPRYIRVDGKPVFLIYQASEVAGGEDWVGRLRRELEKRTGETFLIGTVFSVKFQSKMLDYLDFVVQFPPHRIPRTGRRRTIPAQNIGPFDPERGDYYEAYDDVVEASLDCADQFDRLFLGVCPDWDNTSRRKTNAHTLIGSTPEKFRDWVRQAADVTRQKYAAGCIADKLLFVNAWNEWAEGAVLEPSEENGLSYLEALRDGLSR